MKRLLLLQKDHTFTQPSMIAVLPVGCTVSCGAPLQIASFTCCFYIEALSTNNPRSYFVAHNEKNTQENIRLEPEIRAILEVGIYISQRIH